VPAHIIRILDAVIQRKAIRVEPGTKNLCCAHPPEFSLLGPPDPPAIGGGIAHAVVDIIEIAWESDVGWSLAHAGECPECGKVYLSGVVQPYRRRLPSP
jgi:hypothetical protein